MGVLIAVKRSRFYSELSDEERFKFFNLTCAKILPGIDNIYFVAYIKGDSNDNKDICPLLRYLSELKEQVHLSREFQQTVFGLLLTNLGHFTYKYCLSEPELFDIFVAETLPDEDKNPRFLVQIRSYHIHTHGVDEALISAYNALNRIVSGSVLACDNSRVVIERVMENRIDYCYHTNIVENPQRTLSDEYIKKHLYTNFRKWDSAGDIRQENDYTVLDKDYLLIGRKKSNNVLCRIYNKTKEVVQKGYKAFFFDIWQKSGLINFYDKYCLEKAYACKSWAQIDSARLAFYVKYGRDEDLKRTFSEALTGGKSHEQLKALADAYLPPVTTVINVEFQTMRKFYAPSDVFLNGLKPKPRQNSPAQLARLFKILDNRGVILEYLTRKNCAFIKRGADGKRVKTPVLDENGAETKEYGKAVTEFKYVSWWLRLRNTKLGCLPVNSELLKDYSHALDLEIALKRAVNAIGSTAVYKGRIKTDFVEDVTDLMSLINDNDKRDSQTRFISGFGEVISHIDSEFLLYYGEKKASKNARVKNLRAEQDAEQDGDG